MRAGCCCGPKEGRDERSLDSRRGNFLAQIGFWPKQWSAARMFARTAKGFHVHPPSIPEDTTAADWLRRLFIDEPDNYSLRRYNDEQWDVMFFLQGRAEIILCESAPDFHGASCVSLSMAIITVVATML